MEKIVRVRIDAPRHAAEDLLYACGDTSAGLGFYDAIIYAMIARRKLYFKFGPKLIVRRIESSTKRLRDALAKMLRKRYY